MRSHYLIYEKRCKEANIIPHERCVLPTLLKKRKAEAAKKLAKENAPNVQTKLDFRKTTMPKEFTPENIRHSVSVHVVCGDQALAVAEDVTFRNCLVAMRPTTKAKELPSSHVVKKHISNCYVEHVEAVNRDVGVSVRVTLLIVQLLTYLDIESSWQDCNN